MDQLRRRILRYQPDCEQERVEQRLLLDYIDRCPDILLRSNETAHFSASSWIVDPTHTHTLMVFHNIYNSWSWTGGHADGESDLLAVALREAVEETSLSGVQPLSEEIYSLEILTVNGHFKRGRYVAPHLHLNLTYLLEARDDAPIAARPEENSAVAWFTLENAVEACSEPAMRPVYEKLNRRLAAFPPRA